MLPAWMNKVKSTKTVSKVQEINTAKAFRGQTVIASGSIWTMKGDVKCDKFLIECKYTTKSKYILEYNILEKIRKEAANDSRIPLLEIWMKNNGIEKKYVVINKKDFYTYKSFGDDIVPTIVEFKSVTLNLDDADKYGFPLLLLFKNYNNDSFIIIKREEFLELIDGKVES